MKKSIATSLCPIKNKLDYFANKIIKNDVVVFNYFDQADIANNLTNVSRPIFFANKIFLNHCHELFIKTNITAKSFPTLKEIYIKKNLDSLFYIKKNFGQGEIYVPVSCMYIKCNGNINWQFGFPDENIVPLTEKKYQDQLANCEFIPPIIGLK